MTTVPAPGEVSMESLAPIRDARSLIQRSPKWPSLPMRGNRRAHTFAIVLHTHQKIRFKMQFNLDALCLRMQARIANRLRANVESLFLDKRAHRSARRRRRKDDSVRCVAPRTRRPFVSGRNRDRHGCLWNHAMFPWRLDLRWTPDQATSTVFQGLPGAAAGSVCGFVAVSTISRLPSMVCIKVSCNSLERRMRSSTRSWSLRASASDITRRRYR